MNKMIIRPLTTLAVGALISAQALAFGGHQRGIDWQEELDLTEQQENKIDDIEDRYQEQFHQLRKNSAQRQDHQQQKSMLMKKMRAEIQQVLTKEQRAAARKLMDERRHKAMEKRVQKLVRKLDMSDEQATQLKQTVASHKETYHWPMDQPQRQQARSAFNEAMQNILTPQQQEKWQAMNAKHKKRWRHEPGGDHDGLRKGYQNW